MLKRLKTDYLDLLLIHWPGVNGLSHNSKENAEVRLETWKAMMQLRKDGKVKDIGVSNFLVHHLGNTLWVI
jgi:diketogulonate reductase-like aldo/keto reductase